MGAQHTGSDKGRQQLLRACLLFAVVALPVMATAQPRPMEAGSTFALVEPALPTQTREEVIEVVDVFWYGCPVCREFEPMMTYYGAQIRGDLTLRRQPAVWNPLMKLHARLYYTAQELGNVASIHPRVFAFLQEAQQPLNNKEQVRDFFIAQGVAAADFDAAWQSEKVLAAVDRAEQDTQAAGIDRLPALLVNGRYRVERNAANTELPELVVTTNQLIKSLREERRVD